MLEGKKESPGRFAEVVYKDNKGNVEWRSGFMFWRWLELKYPKAYTAVIIAEAVMIAAAIIKGFT